MRDEPENPMQVYLRRIDLRVEKRGDDMLEVKQRLGQLEHQYASISRRSDSLDLQLDRIERRLDIAEMVS
jgi:hypothetical protein